MKPKLIILVALAGVFLFFAIGASAITTWDRDYLINQIQQQILRLQQQLFQIRSQQTSTVNPPATTATCADFNRNLRQGDIGIDVKNLHSVLEKEGFTISSGDKQFSYFGVSTASAVSKFQEKYASEILTPLRLSSGTGNVATLTRQKLNSLYGCNKTVLPPACVPNWQCSGFGDCVSGIQSQTCQDTNNCGTIAGKPAESQSCGAIPDTCQSVDAPGLVFSCLKNISPYGVSGDFIISNEQYLAWSRSFGVQYQPQQYCGCSWEGREATDTLVYKLSCPSPTTGCDFTKVPDTLSKKTFMAGNSCSSLAEADYVEWSSRLAKGELLDQAYQNMVLNMRRLILIGEEKQCVQKKVYYIGGDLNSPSWMCSGDKYRLNPNSIGAQWQKWVDNSWTYNFSSACSVLPQPSACKLTSTGCTDAAGSYSNSCVNKYVTKKYACQSDKCVAKNYKCTSGDCSSWGSCSGKLVEEFCNDSDIGGYLNYVTKGTCEDSFVAGFPYSDRCTDSNLLLEYYCGNQIMLGLKCLGQTVRCSAGCGNGACLPDNTIHNPVPR